MKYSWRVVLVIVAFFTLSTMAFHWCTEPLLLRPSISLSVDPREDVVYPGGGKQVQLLLSGHSNTVDLTFSSIPPEATARFDENNPTIAPGEDLRYVYLDTTERTPPGKYDLTILATERGGYLPAHGTVHVYVVERGTRFFVEVPDQIILEPDFPKDLFIRIVHVYGFTGDVALSVTSDAEDVRLDLVTVNPPDFGRYNLFTKMVRSSRVYRMTYIPTTPTLTSAELFVTATSGELDVQRLTVPIFFRPPVSDPEGSKLPPATIAPPSGGRPIASYVSDPPDGIARVGQPITLDARSSRDADGEIVSYEWVLRSEDFLAVSDDPVYSIIERFPRRLEVLLTVTDNDGLANTATGFVEWR